MEMVTIHGDEWKKEDVEEPIAWAKTKKWSKTQWYSDSENWDHDHCQICWWKLYKSEQPEHSIGYHNSENDNWLCTECFEQFVEIET
ncbi:hypothetical protein IOQ59_10165 [Pontibacterium sp. N1Y112]|uniref:Uncharacterized protein n=1 Tax=Pontibacterium sinense TaxID=2781979 RepID=A0A8J7FDV7_9GAMM|nr:hypothetical protein [Pontibacterium sinense]MBE9397624.1 hypothetical protein [Pontibacterium sinense]